MRAILWIFIGCFSFCLTSLQANNIEVQQYTMASDTILPKVFQLGDFENQYDDLLMKYETSLLAACDSNMEDAFEKWLSMIKEMEAYADLIEYDIKGIKVWLNVFWEKGGSVEHIAYYLKPNSRNVDRDEFRAFLSSFMNHYVFPLKTKKGFAHYGSAAFPTMPTRMKDQPQESPKPAMVKDSVRAGE